MRMIYVSDGASMVDPADVAPIHVMVDGRIVTVATIGRWQGWRARLAVWLLRTYVTKCLTR